MNQIMIMIIQILMLALLVFKKMMVTMYCLLELNLEQLNNNNNIIRQNEQSLQVEVCELEPRDSRGVFKNINVDMRQYNKLLVCLFMLKMVKPGQFSRW